MTHRDPHFLALARCASRTGRAGIAIADTSGRAVYVDTETRLPDAPERLLARGDGWNGRLYASPRLSPRAAVLALRLGVAEVVVPWGATRGDHLDDLLDARDMLMAAGIRVRRVRVGEMDRVAA